MTIDPVANPGVAGAGATLRIYVAGQSPDSTRALERLQRALDILPAEKAPAVEVIDVFTSPLSAMEDGVVVTPTLVLRTVSVTSTMFGDLSNPGEIDALLSTLDV